MACFPLALHPTIPEDLTKLDPRDALREDMAFIHNVLFRLLNSIYAHADAFPPNDLPDFLIFISAFGDIAKYHHLGEEKFLFPRLEKDMPAMAKNKEQHEIIHKLLESLNDFVTETQANPEKYSPQALREILDKYAPTCHEHFFGEIETLDPAVLRKYISGEEIVELLQKEIAWVIGQSNAPLTIPATLGSHDRRDNPTWPNVPQEVFEALPGLSTVHAGAWRFLPFSLATGEPQKFA